MIALVATLVERSRGPDLRLQLSPRDYNAVAGGKVFQSIFDSFIFSERLSLCIIRFRTFHFYISKLKTT